MDQRSFKDWLDAFGRARESRDPKAAARLFTDDAPYYETPFDGPAGGREGISENQARAARWQRDIHISSEILAITGDKVIRQWRVAFTAPPSNTRIELDGIFLAGLNGDGLCSRFR